MGSALLELHRLFFFFVYVSKTTYAPMAKTHTVRGSASVVPRSRAKQFHPQSTHTPVPSRAPLVRNGIVYAQGR